MEAATKAQDIDYEEQTLSDAAKTMQAAGHGSTHRNSLLADNPSNIPAHRDPTSNVTGAKINTMSSSSNGSRITTVSIV